MAQVAAIIPARGGSKGIPGKNLCPLLGKPMIAYTIEAALASRHVTRVFVSTDDAGIADASRRYGAEVIARPAEISGDTASSESALIHALEHLKTVESYAPEILVFLQCTSPLMLPEDIDGTVNALLDERADSALSAYPSHLFLWRRDASGQAEGVNHLKTKRPRRQEREPEYAENGAVYVMRASGFLEARHRFFGKTAIFPMARERSVEIDDPADLELVEALIAQRESGSDAQSARAARVKLLVTDVDGVLTDAGMYYAETGDELKKFNTRDGMGLEKLRTAGIATAIMTREKTELVARRAAKLKVDHLHQGVADKGRCMDELAAAAGLTFDEIAFVGDDYYDIPALNKAGFACCPSDAAAEVRKHCHLVLGTGGGQGCIREVAEFILRARENFSES